MEIKKLTVNAKANISLEDREEMLRIRSSTGKEASVRITQDGVPFMANIGVVPRNIFPSGIGYPIEKARDIRSLASLCEVYGVIL